VKLVADESVEGPTVYALRAAAHEVLFVAEISPGIADSAVLEIARREDALLLTADKDFGELVFRSREPHRGVLLIRPLERSPEQNAANTLAALNQFGTELLNNFCALAQDVLRIRKPHPQDW
jgi:predicted nuclease of predicted toxin-antitoxin system